MNRATSIDFSVRRLKSSGPNTMAWRTSWSRLARRPLTLWLPSGGNRRSSILGRMAKIVQTAGIFTIHAGQDALDNRR